MFGRSRFGDGRFGAAPKAAAAPAGRSLSANAGAIAMAGASVNLLRGTALPAAAGVIAVSGPSTIINRARILPAGQVGLTLMSPANAVVVARRVTASSGSIGMVGVDAMLRRGFLLSAAAGIVGVAGTPAALRRGFALVGSPASIVTTGGPAALRRGGSQLLAGYTATVAGSPAALRLGRLAAIGAAAIALTRFPAVLRRGFLVSADRGSFASSGSDASLRRSPTIIAGLGSYTLTCPDIAGGTAARRIIAARAAFALIGAVEVRIARVLPANRGGFAAGGRAAALIRGHTLAAAPAGVLLTGSAATMRVASATRFDGARYVFSPPGAAIRRQLVVRAEPGSMITSAEQVGTTRSRRLVAEATALFASSAPVALLRRRVLPALRGAVSFVGGAASFLHSTGFEILPGNRFVVRGRQRAFIIPARQRTFIIRKGKCMSSISKYPAEERQYQADWSADLNGQTIVGEITAISTDPALIVSKVTYAGPIMKFWLEGGASGRRSTISFIAATSGGEELVWSQTVICY